MAWTKVGQTTFIVDEGTTPDITLPGTLAQDDIVIALLVCDSAMDAATIGIADAQGYTNIDKPTNAGPGRQLCWKRMGATPDTVVAVQGEGSRKIAGIIQVWRGADTTDAIDATAVEANGSSSSIDPPSYTTVTDGALRIIVGCLDDDDSASITTAPSGWTDFLAADTGQGSTSAGATVMVASKVATTAGAEDPAAFTSSSDVWRAYHFALRPAAGGGANLLRVVGETLGTAEAGARPLALTRLRAEPLAVVETPQRAMVLLRPVAEALGLSEARQTVRGLQKLVNELVGLTEMAMWQRGRTQIVAEAVAASEALARLLGLNRLVPEPVSVSEVALRLRDLVRARAEPEGVTEARLRTLALFRTQVEPEGITATSQHVRGLSRLRGEAEAIAETTVSLVSAVGAALVHILSEAVGLVEIARAVRVLVRLRAEVLALAEAAVRSKAMRRARTEAVGFVESVARTVGLTRARVESVALAELAARSLALVRARTSAIAITSAVVTARGLARVRDETLALTEATVGVALRTLVRVRVEALALTESVVTVISQLVAGFGSRMFQLRRRRK